MPRYFIDSDDGDLTVLDTDGYELPNVQQARIMAIEALPDMARDRIPNGDRRDFTVRVRDENGTVLYSASLTLVGEWHVTPP